MIPTHAYRRPAPTGLGFAYNITTSIAPPRGLAFGVYTSFRRAPTGLAGWLDGRLVEIANMGPLFHKMHASLYYFPLLDYYSQEALGLCFLKTLTTGISYLFKAFTCLSIQQGVPRVSVLRTPPYLL